MKRFLDLGSTRRAAAALLVLATLSQPVQGLEDRIVAVVDGDPILESEIRRAVALGQVEARPEESREALRRRALDELIDFRLRTHEVDRFGFGQAPDEEVDAQVEAIRAGFESEEAFAAELDSLGLTPRELHQIVARQLLTLAYVEERLGARVFVDLENIQAYYDSTYVEAARSQGETPLPIQEVREEIRALLQGQRLNEEIESWTQELREDAEILDFLDSPRSELPPIVETFDDSSDG